MWRAFPLLLALQPLGAVEPAAAMRIERQIRTGIAPRNDEHRRPAYASGATATWEVGVDSKPRDDAHGAPPVSGTLATRTDHVSVSASVSTLIASCNSSAWSRAATVDQGTSSFGGTGGSASSSAGAASRRMRDTGSGRPPTRSSSVSPSVSRTLSGSS